MVAAIRRFLSFNKLDTTKRARNVILYTVVIKVNLASSTTVTYQAAK